MGGLMESSKYSQKVHILDVDKRTLSRENTNKIQTEENRTKKANEISVKSIGNMCRYVPQ